MEKKIKYTRKQHNAIFAYCQDVADGLNDSGKDMRKVLKPEVEIPWTKESIYNIMWKGIQEVMFDTDSITKLETDQVSKIYETVNRHTAKHGVSVKFPSKEEEMLKTLT